jgi:hypothetical protein
MPLAPLQPPLELLGCLDQASEALGNKLVQPVTARQLLSLDYLSVGSG